MKTFLIIIIILIIFIIVQYNNPIHIGGTIDTSEYSINRSTFIAREFRNNVLNPSISKIGLVLDGLYTFNIDNISIISCGANCLVGIPLQEYNNLSIKQQIFRLLSYNSSNDECTFTNNDNTIILRLIQNIESSTSYNIQYSSITTNINKYMRINHTLIDNKYNIHPITNLMELPSIFSINIYNPIKLFDENAIYKITDNLGNQLVINTRGNISPLFLPPNDISTYIDNKYKSIYFRIIGPIFNTKYFIFEYIIVNITNFSITNTTNNEYKLQYRKLNDNSIIKNMITSPYKGKLSEYKDIIFLDIHDTNYSLFNISKVDINSINFNLTIFFALTHYQK